MKVATASDENYKLYGPGKNSGTEGSRELRNSGLVEFSDTRIVCMVCIVYVFLPELLLPFVFCKCQ